MNKTQESHSEEGELSYQVYCYHPIVYVFCTPNHKNKSFLKIPTQNWIICHFLLDFVFQNLTETFSYAVKYKVNISQLFVKLESHIRDPNNSENRGTHFRLADF